MFKAVDEYKNQISIDDASRAIKYYCPICQGSLIIKATTSKSVAAHFAHKSRKDCDTFSHDMSDWHKEWQNRFPLRNREVPLPFENPCHRADVLACGYVIEFQHSPISLDEFNERNRFYTSLGKKMVWVFDLSDQYENQRLAMVNYKKKYIYDGSYTDRYGNLRKIWKLLEYRIGKTFRAVVVPTDISENFGSSLGYEYGENGQNSRFKDHEWNWTRPLKTFSEYNPMVNTDIILFFEFEPGNLNRVIWCDDVVDETIADNIAEGLHGDEFAMTPSVERYLEYRNRFIINSDYRHFTATEYTIKDFMLSIKNRKL